MAEPVLDIRDLRLEAPVFPADGPPRQAVLVDGVSLSVARGRVLGLIGESGAGKSTIGLSALAYGRGEVRITGGSVALNGRALLAQSPRALRGLRGAEVTYVAQSAAAAFNPAKRLMHQVVEATVLHGRMSRRAAEQRAVALFAKLRLPDPETFGQRFPHQVSGGQLQRAMTALALCPAPDLVVFDEPTTALDVTTQIDVLAAIKDAIADSGVAALYITHDLAVVAQIADEIMVLKDGRTVEVGPTEQVIHRPREDYTRALVSVRSIAHAEKAPTARPVLEVEGVSARYRGARADVLRDVSLALHPGQTLAVVGESGSGKSTLARVVTGLLPPRRGDLRFAGARLAPEQRARSRETRRDLQMVYQMADVALNPRHSVETIIGRPLEFYFGLKGEAKRQRVHELLDQIHLDASFCDRYPAELSGGQKQRVSLARALAAKPRVIICDEVTSALDPLVADGILKLLLELQAAEGVAYLFITHDLATVRAIADSVAVMHGGRVVRYGAKSEVLSPPFDDYTDLLLASVPEMRVGWLEEAIAHRKMEGAGN